MGQDFLDIRYELYSLFYFTFLSALYIIGFGSMLEYGSTRLSSKSHESRIYLHHTTENTEKYIDKYIKINKREK